MAKHSRLFVLTKMIETGLVPLFYETDVEVAMRIVQACMDGGAYCIEFTNRGDRAHNVFEGLVNRIGVNNQAILGVGSIIDSETASIYIQLGANFIVGPMFNFEVARLCNRRKIAYIPGCGTVTEISQAEEMGVEICKIFPGSSVGGASFIKSVLGPMPWVHLMPTGGVEAKKENIFSWFDAGAACVGMGSNLVTKDWVAAREYTLISETVHQLLSWIQEARKGNSSIT